MMASLLMQVRVAQSRAMITQFIPIEAGPDSKIGGRMSGFENGRTDD